MKEDKSKNDKKLIIPRELKPRNINRRRKTIFEYKENKTNETKINGTGEQTN